MTLVSLPAAGKPGSPVNTPLSAQARSRWNDPVSLIQNEAPPRTVHMVLWIVCALTLVLFVWAAFGKLDIVATTEGKLVPQTLVKIVQPAEAGVVRQILVAEGDVVAEGQWQARRKALGDATDQEHALLRKAHGERRSA